MVTSAFFSDIGITLMESDIPFFEAINLDILKVDAYTGVMPDHSCTEEKALVHKLRKETALFSFLPFCGVLEASFEFLLLADFQFCCIWSFTVSSLNGFVCSKNKSDRF